MDVQEATVSRLVAYLEATVPPRVLAATNVAMATTQEGWPEWEADSPLNQGAPGLSVTPQRHVVMWMPPCAVTKTQNPDDPNILDIVYKLGNVEMDILLDAWSPYKAQLDCVAAEVECSLHNRLPFTTGLTLQMPDYYNTYLSVYANTLTQRTVTSRSQQQRHHRRTWTLKVNLPLLCSGPTPKQAVLSLQHTTTVGGVQITEPSFEVT